MRSLLRKLLGRLRRSRDSLVLAILTLLFHRRNPHLADVFFAYRLLLDRAPDEEGWRHYGREVRTASYPTYWLTECFLRSQEFLAKQEKGHDYDTMPVDEKVVRVEGLKIVVDANDTFIGATILRSRRWEPEVTALVRAVLLPGQVFVDIGANIGFFSLLAARLVGPGGRVVAVEPISHNYRLLEKSIQLNGLTNIELKKVALSNENGTMTFIQNARYNSGSFHLTGAAGWTGRSYAIETRRLDDLVGQGQVDLVKIDVEGAEGLVFEGMAETLRRWRPIVLLEYSNVCLVGISRMTGETLLARFRQLGYAAQPIVPDQTELTDHEAAEIDRLLEEAGGGHLDLVLFPRELAGRRPSDLASERRGCVLSGRWPAAGSAEPGEARARNPEREGP